jgi:hypothetical protein
MPASATVRSSQNRHQSNPSETHIVRYPHRQGYLTPQEAGMIRSTRRIRIVGYGRNLHVRASGDWDTEPLEGLREACRVTIALDKLTRESVKRARDAGASWTQIGDALGVTKQAAWERFSGED